MRAICTTLCATALMVATAFGEGSRVQHQCDPERDLGASDGYTMYMCSGGTWVVDNAAMKRAQAAEDHRRELYWALRSRVLTDDEMAEVEKYDFRLVIAPMQTYMEKDKREEFNAALLQQFKLRKAAQEIASPSRCVNVAQNDAKNGG